ncbi:MAG: hypothetical protein ACYDEX_00335 [Mobilitalea sp.]
MSPTGHIAIGFATRNYAPQIPLFVFIAASYAIDLIYMLFVALGIDSIGYAPWSHSLLMVVTWSTLTVLITMSFTKRFKTGLILGLVIFSHWILDFFVWNDMLIVFNKNIRVGLGLYNRIGFSQTGFMEINTATMIASLIELSMLVIGIVRYVLYLKKARKRVPLESQSSN